MDQIFFISELKAVVVDSVTKYYSYFTSDQNSTQANSDGYVDEDESSCDSEFFRKIKYDESSSQTYMVSDIEDTSLRDPVDAIIMIEFLI